MATNKKKTMKKRAGVGSSKVPVAVVAGGGSVSSRDKIIDIIRVESKNEAIRKRLLYLSEDR
ncbi:MAG: hypothetical protein ACREOB_09015 [Thermodesulfobacteriota bacterium]